jgi:hypothetical protein
MSRLSRVIAPMLHAAGLDVRPVGRADGEPQELIVTNPRQPSWGRVIIDRDGRLQWHYWGDAVTDAGAASIADVVIAVLAPRPASSIPGPPARSHQRSVPSLTSETRHQPRGLALVPGRLVAPAHRGCLLTRGPRCPRPPGR